MNIETTNNLIIGSIIIALALITASAILAGYDLFGMFVLVILGAGIGGAIRGLNNIDKI